MRTSSSLCGALPHLLKSEQASRERAGATIVCLRNPKGEKQDAGESLLGSCHLGSHPGRPWMSVRLMTALASAPIAQLLLTVLDANTQITQNTTAYVQTYTSPKTVPKTSKIRRNFVNLVQRISNRNLPLSRSLSVPPRATRRACWLPPSFVHAQLAQSQRPAPSQCTPRVRHTMCIHCA